MGRFLCSIGLHSWRDVSRAGSGWTTHVCRRGCGERRELWTGGVSP